MKKKGYYEYSNGIYPRKLWVHIGRDLNEVIDSCFDGCDYSYKNDVDLDGWLEEYASNNNTYYMDQRKNYSHMVNDFRQYQKRIAAA